MHARPVAFRRSFHQSSVLFLLWLLWCVQYGQTGAGKSHTMEGIADPPELRGIIPSSFKHIFERIAGNVKPGKQFLVRASYLEIYNEVCGCSVAH